MVEDVLVIIQPSVLKVKLDKLHAVSEAIKWHLFALYDRYEIVAGDLSPMRLEHRYCLQVTLQGVVALKLLESQPTGLSVEKVSCVEHRLSFVPGHFGKHVGFLGHLSHPQRQISMLEAFHRLEIVCMGLASAH